MRTVDPSAKVSPIHENQSEQPIIIAATARSARHRRHAVGGHVAVDVLSPQRARAHVPHLPYKEAAYLGSYHVRGELPYTKGVLPYKEAAV